MLYRTTAVAVLILASPIAAAQQPIPLLPQPQSQSQSQSSGAPAVESTPLGAPTVESTPLAAPPASGPAAGVAPDASPPSQPLTAPTAAAAPQAPAASRVFCGQDVTYHLADPGSAPGRYSAYLGIFSDAAWTPALCAALIVEGVQGDGTAAITYVFGPMGSGSKTPSGVLHGTGIVKDDALLFQNSDGSQYQFKPYYTDFAGHWTTPTGQSYDAIFKRSY